jgi:hypothetical protein
MPHEPLSAPELQALCDAHARALCRLRQEKRDLLCAVGLGVGLGLVGVATTLLWAKDLGVLLSVASLLLNTGILLLTVSRVRDDNPLSEERR